MSDLELNAEMDALRKHSTPQENKIDGNQVTGKVGHFKTTPPNTPSQKLRVEDGLGWAEDH